MRAEQNRLWADIREFEIDDAASPTFVKKLGRQQGWTSEFTERAVEEYRRFVYLAMVSPTQVTPSEIVDEVWHLHLQYTVSYWERLHRILPRKLHHHPSKGGSSEDGRIARQYRETLDLYEAVFGDSAPSDLWPRQRADVKASTTEGQDTEYWRVPKRQARWTAAVAALGLMASLGAGCAPLLAQDTSAGFGLALLGAGAVVVVVLIVAAIVKRGQRGGGGAPGNHFTGGPGYYDSGFHGSSSHIAHSSDGHHLTEGSGTAHGSAGDASTDGTSIGQSAVSESSSSDSGSSGDSGGSSGGDASSGCGGGGCGGGGCGGGGGD